MKSREEKFTPPHRHWVIEQTSRVKEPAKGQARTKVKRDLRTTQHEE